MARKDENLVDKTFGLLSVKEFYGLIDHKRYWLCDCECGEKDVLAYTKQLKNGTKKSCGCLKKSAGYSLGKNNKKFNKYDLSGEYGIGYTSKGEEFYFDLEDYDKIKDYCWYINDEGYVICNSSQIFMHDLVMNVGSNFSVDHIHHKTNDNRKTELRTVTHSNNCMNRHFNQNTKSGVTGVTWCEDMSKWRVRIGVNNKRITIGYFADIDKAINARKQAEEKYFGEYSYENSMKMEEKY